MNVSIEALNLLLLFLPGAIWIFSLKPTKRCSRALELALTRFPEQLVS